jgi:hypothetical protein
MPTLSQPQKPAALDSPSEKYRDRLERLTENLETPSLDDRKYRVVRLSNQLEALLVHDADTDKASAAMDVNVGNFSDDEDMQGMAHAVRIPSSLYPIPFPHCTPETCIRSYMYSRYKLKRSSFPSHAPRNVVKLANADDTIF